MLIWKELKVPPEVALYEWTLAQFWYYTHSLTNVLKMLNGGSDEDSEHSSGTKPKIDGKNVTVEQLRALNIPLRR